MNMLDELHKTVLNNILYLINQKGLSDIDFCRALNLGDKTLDNWKRGISKTYMKKTKLIADYFDVSEDSLYGSGQKNKPTDTVDELDELEIKIVKLFSQLTPQNKQLALAQIGAILNAQDNQLV